VKFPPKESGPQGTAGSGVSGNDEATALLQDVRLLRKDELQVCFQINLFTICGKNVNLVLNFPLKCFICLFKGAVDLILM